MSNLFRKFPIYFSDLIILIFALILKLITANFGLRKSLRTQSARDFIVLGNGPSLKEDVNNLLMERSEAEFCVVNYFANTELFEKIKPTHYVLIDPVFWKSGINENIRKDNEELIKNLLKVTWKINVICEASGYKTLRDMLISNSNITVKKIKHNWFDLRSEKANIFALRSGLSTPNLANVLIGAVWYSLISGKKNIIIYGADFSSFKELRVDQNTNRVFTSSTHFYQESHDLAAVKEKYIGVPPKMINIRFYQVWVGFRQMYYLAVLAKAWNVNIVNKSSFSYLDCFDRD